MDVKIVTFNETKIAFIEHHGSQNKVMETVSKFIEWRKESQLSPVHTSKTFAINYFDPKSEEPSQFRMDICGSIVCDTVPENQYGVKAGVIPGGRCAVVRHYGSHDAIGAGAQYLFQEWLPQSGHVLRDFPLFFHYLNLIPFVEEQDLITDIYLPLLSNEG